MLRLIIEGDEVFDEETQTFSTINDIEVDLEHSLVSLSKWESKHQIPFLSNEEKTSEQLFDYIKFMVVTENFNLDLLYNCSEENLKTIQNYVDSKQSATTFFELKSNQKVFRRSETITSELIYYWMVAFNIPFECQYWHLNRLFSLIKICGIKQEKPKKIPKNEIAQRNRELNAKRKAQLGTSG